MTIVCLILFVSCYAFPQFDIIEKVKKKTEEKVEKETDKAIDDALDGEEETKEEGVKEEESTDVSNESNVSSTENVSSKKELKSYSKFDFIPGTKLIFYDDFSMDAVGDFPQKWNTNGSGEVVTLNSYPGNWFKLQNAVSFLPYLELNSFGDNFTIEVDFLYDVPEELNYGTLYFDFYSSDKVDEVPSASSGPYSPGILFDFYADKFGSAHFNAVGVSADFTRSSPNVTDVKAFNDGAINRLSFSFNKQRFRVYLNEKKVMDLPRILQAGLNINHVNLRTWYWNTDHDYSILIKDIRIAQGQADTRNDLITHGKIVTHGILFDSGSDKIKPESYGTLKDIAATLKENSSIKVKVVGHTDSDGSDENNLDLSKRRAASVKNALVNEFAIPDSQLDTDGKGESEPVEPNDSPEGKANNRRVEFIKL
jgi:outer membrane protein OmpA-like peptidoglycan-associated protein